MGRKFSAPGYLCPSLPTPASTTTGNPTTTHHANPANPAVPLGARKGSLGPVGPGFGYASASYNASQWAGPTGNCQVGMLTPAQYQPPMTAPVSMHQGYHMGTTTPATQKSVSQGGSNLRPT